jgi:hypothetical protein
MEFDDGNGVGFVKKGFLRLQSFTAGGDGWSESA